jgi:hypothetical protein
MVDRACRFAINYAKPVRVRVLLAPPTKDGNLPPFSGRECLSKIQRLTRSGGPNSLSPWHISLLNRRNRDAFSGPENPLPFFFCGRPKRHRDARSKVRAANDGGTPCGLILASPSTSERTRWARPKFKGECYGSYQEDKPNQATGFYHLVGAPEAARWNKTGAAWSHHDRGGFSLLLEYVPLTRYGRLVLRSFPKEATLNVARAERRPKSRLHSSRNNFGRSALLREPTNSIFCSEEQPAAAHY